MRTRTRLLTLGAVAGAITMLHVGVAAAATTDANRDGLPDSWERRHGLSLAVNQSGRDQDRDGLRNLAEYRAGTAPRDRDSDDDGMTDLHENPDADGLTNRMEQNCATMPRDRDSDDDGTTDANEDNDRDGLSSREEHVVGSVCRDRDSDDDGTFDGREDRDGDGLDDSSEFDFGCNPRDPDSDDDGQHDGLDTIGTVASWDPATRVLALTLTNGTIASFTLSSTVVVEVDKPSGGGGEDTPSSVDALVPGTVLKELERTLAGIVTKVEIANPSDLAGESTDD